MIGILRKKKLWGLPALPLVLVLLMATTAWAAYLRPDLNSNAVDGPRPLLTKYTKIQTTR